MGLSAPHWEASSAGEGNEAKRCDFSSSTQYVLKTEKKERGTILRVAKYILSGDSGSVSSM